MVDDITQTTDQEVIQDTQTNEMTLDELFNLADQTDMAIEHDNQYTEDFIQMMDDLEEDQSEDSSSGNAPLI